MSSFVGRTGIAVRNISRADPMLVDELNQFGVATVHEAQGRKGLLDNGIRPIQKDQGTSGSAVTVLVAPGDNWMFHVAVEQCQPGDILVVGTSSPCTDGYFGDLLATSLMARGVRGLVIDAGVRDTRTLREMGFLVWSRNVHSQGTVKETIGSVNTPVICAGQLVEPGDVVVADDDGVVIVRRQEAMTVLASSRKRAELEEQKRVRLAAGELGLDIYGMRQKLADRGLVYYDSINDVKG